MRIGILTVGLAALALSGCEAIPNQAHRTDPNFGRAVRQNIAAQVADPAPNYDYTDPPASGGERTALAQDRYEKGQVIPPVTQGTSSVISSGGSGK